MISLSSVFFIIVSIVVISYFIYIFKNQKKLPVIFEIFFLGVYVMITIIFLFPKSIDFIEQALGIQSAINFITYLSIFVAYFIMFVLFKEKEAHRIEITELNREIALLKDEKDIKNKKK